MMTKQGILCPKYLWKLVCKTISFGQSSVQYGNSDLTGKESGEIPDMMYFRANSLLKILVAVTYNAVCIRSLSAHHVYFAAFFSSASCDRKSGRRLLIGLRT